MQVVCSRGFVGEGSNPPPCCGGCMGEGQMQQGPVKDGGGMVGGGQQNASHVTRHTSHITRHTSHVTRHTSHVTRRMSHVTCTQQQACRSDCKRRWRAWGGSDNGIKCWRMVSDDLCVTRHTSHVTRHTSHVTRHTSHTSHVADHLRASTMHCRGNRSAAAVKGGEGGERRRGARERVGGGHCVRGDGREMRMMTTAAVVLMNAWVEKCCVCDAEVVSEGTMLIGWGHLTC
jgi:hypothetical protein